MSGYVKEQLMSVVREPCHVVSGLLEFFFGDMKRAGKVWLVIH